MCAISHSRACTCGRRLRSDGGGAGRNLRQAGEEANHNGRCTTAISKMACMVARHLPCVACTVQGASRDDQPASANVARISLPSFVAKTTTVVLLLTRPRTTRATSSRSHVVSCFMFRPSRVRPPYMYTYVYLCMATVGKYAALHAATTALRSPSSMAMTVGSAFLRDEVVKI